MVLEVMGIGPVDEKTENNTCQVPVIWNCALRNWVLKKINEKCITMFLAT